MFGWTIPREEQNYSVLTEQEKSYIAGFLDGDGCIMFQLIRRKDYRYGYQIRASVVFYQKTIHADHLLWLQNKFNGIGYFRNRNDGMSEYTIVGITDVITVLKLLKPYIRLKRKHIIVAFKIAKLLPRYKRLDDKLLLRVSQLVDSFGSLNYSKRRRNTTTELKAFLNAVPRND